MFWSSQPSRVLAVTGIFTASTMPLTSAAVLSNSVIIAEPPPMLTTLRTAQPMLISMEATPVEARKAAASRISSGTDPKSWTASGESSGRVSISLKAFSRFSSNERALTKSVVQRPTLPSSRTTSRNGKFVYPASGERNKFDGNVSEPNCMYRELLYRKAVKQLNKLNRLNETATPQSLFSNLTCLTHLTDQMR